MRTASGRPGNSSFSSFSICRNCFSPASTVLSNVIYVFRKDLTYVTRGAESFPASSGISRAMRAIKSS